MKFRKKTLLLFVLLSFSAYLYHSSIHMLESSFKRYVLRQQKAFGVKSTMGDDGIALITLENKFNYSVEDYINYGNAMLDFAFSVTNVEILRPLDSIATESLREIKNLYKKSNATNLEFGILLIIFPGMTPDAKSDAMGAAYDQAIMIRQVEPHINISVVIPPYSELDVARLREMIDLFIIIPPILNDDSFTKVHAMKLSPYETTLLLDSHLIICYSFSEILKQTFMEHKMDLVFSGVAEYNQMVPIGDADLSVLMYRKSDNFTQTMNEWISAMKENDELIKKDADIFYFHRILSENKYSIRIGRLNATFGGIFRPVDYSLLSSSKYQHTMIMDGYIRFLRFDTIKSSTFKSEICQLINSNLLKRIVTWNKDLYPDLFAYNVGYRLKMAFNKHECDHLLGKNCSDASWSSRDLITILEKKRGIVKSLNPLDVPSIGAIMWIFADKYNQSKAHLDSNINAVNLLRKTDPNTHTTLFISNRFLELINNASTIFDRVILVICLKELITKINNDIIDANNQELNLLQVMLKSPYNFTICMIPDVSVCSEFTKEYLDIMSSQELDFAIPSNSKANDLVHDIFVYRKSAKMSLKLKAFKSVIQNPNWSKNIASTQHEFLKFLMNSNLKVANLSPKQLLLVHNSTSLMRYPLIKGPIQLVHRHQNSNYSVNDLCLFLNSNLNTRIIVHGPDQEIQRLKNITIRNDTLSYNPKIADFSLLLSREECATVFRTSCSTDKWDPPEHLI